MAKTGAMTIPAAAEPEVMRRASNGWSPGAIATWLQGEYGVQIHSRTVAAYVNQNREFKTLAAKVRAMEFVGADLKEIEATIERAVELRQQAKAEGLPHLEAVALDLEMSVRMFRLRLAVEVGLLEPNDERLPAAIRGPKGPRKASVRRAH